MNDLKKQIILSILLIISFILSFVMSIQAEEAHAVSKQSNASIVFTTQKSKRE